MRGLAGERRGLLRVEPVGDRRASRGVAENPVQLLDLVLVDGGHGRLDYRIRRNR